MASHAEAPLRFEWCPSYTAARFMVPRRVSGAPLQPGGHGRRLAHHAQHVRAGEAREVAIGPAPANELGKQVRVARDVAQTIGLEVGAVEVAAQPDVVDSGRAD